MNRLPHPKCMKHRKDIPVSFTKTFDAFTKRVSTYSVIMDNERRHPLTGSRVVASKKIIVWGFGGELEN